MTLKTQKLGQQWKLEDIKDGIEEFFKRHGKYPTATEFDLFEHLPSSRQIQRRFGGLIELRKTLSLKGQKDYTKGDHSSKRAKKINKRSHTLEKKVYDYLKDRFGVEFVHREYLFTDDGRSRTDFFVYDLDGNFSVDVFYPRDRHSLIGCLNSKLSKYGNNLLLQYPVIFLQMNNDIDEGVIKNILENKKKSLRSKQSLMTWNMFKKFCAKRGALELKSKNG